MASLKFIEPMYARAVEKLPEGRDWLYEIKLDGYRCLAGRDSKGVILWSRRANIFTTQFPRITRGFEKLQPATLIDGEIVAIDVTEKELESISESACEKITESSAYALICGNCGCVYIPGSTSNIRLGELRGNHTWISRDFP